MRNSISRGPSLIATMTLVGIAIVVAAGLTLGTLWAAGVDLRFWTKKELPIPDGVPVPMSARAIPAGTALTREHFRDPRTGERTVAYMPQSEVERLGIIAKESELVNRVVKDDLPVGRVITEKNLGEKGTRQGETGLIEPGMRLFVLPAEKVQGIHGLKRGDRFDLVASVAVDVKAQGKVIGANVNIQASGKHADVKPVVTNGVVIVPLTVREITTGTVASKGGKLPSKPVEEVKIAIDPKEVAPLQEALAIQANLVCVARSGRPDEAKMKSATPGSSPPPPVHAMEVIHGSKRETLVFPTIGKGPAEPASPGTDSIAESLKK